MTNEAKIETMGRAWNAWWASVSTGASDKHMQCAFEAGYTAATEGMVPRAVPEDVEGLVERMLERLRAAQDYYDEAHIQLPEWLAEHRKAVTALTSLASTVADLERQLAEARKQALPRLTATMIEAAKVAHYGKRSRDLEIGMTADDINWTFEQGFRRMWSGIRAQLAQKGGD